MRSQKILVRVVARGPVAKLWPARAVFTFERGGQSLVGFEAVTPAQLAVQPCTNQQHGVGWFWVSSALRGQLVRKVKAAYPGVWKTITVEVPKRRTPSRGRRAGVLTMADLRTCSVVDRLCERPPGYGAAGFGHADTSPDEFTGPAATCYACGQDVCRSCSKVRRWRVFDSRRTRFVIRWCRICNGCRDEARQHRRRRRSARASTLAPAPVELSIGHRAARLRHGASV